MKTKHRNLPVLTPDQPEESGVILLRFDPRQVQEITVRIGRVRPDGLRVATFEYVAHDGTTYATSAPVDPREDGTIRAYCPRCGEPAETLNSTERGIVCDACIERSR